MRRVTKKSTCKDRSADLGGMLTLLCLKAFRPRGFIGILGGYRKNIREKAPYKNGLVTY